MLLQLNIKNFALIQNLSINFERGFNVFSGETGAGKSILIGAIGYVLGEKSNRDFIRFGEDHTYVEAVFTIENNNIKEVLHKLEIQYEDLIIISRETFKNGKSINKINGKSILVANLKLISSYLIDIHGQHENQNLLDSSSHIQYLDSFGQNKISGFLKAYEEDFKSYNEMIKKITEIQGVDGENEKLKDFLKYQIDEIDKAELKIGEDEELNEKYSILSNTERINNALNFSYESLYDSSNQSSSIFDKLGAVIKELNSAERYTDKIKKVNDLVKEAYYDVEESANEIRDIEKNIVFDDNELEKINERIYKIENLKKKYGNEISDIIKYRDKISNQYEEMVNSRQIIEELQKKKDLKLKSMKEKSLKVHEIRVKIAKELEKRIQNELNFIGLDKSRLKIDVTLGNEYTMSGADKVQFMISTNPGEPLKPLEKVVSGGELSRIMLALKVVFIDKDMIPSVIFDEIDTGISGKIAQCVAEKMYSISGSHQVFCVTHLPQIACMSDVHYVVTKEFKDNKTFTIVKRVNETGKIAEIARLLGTGDVTHITEEHAKEIINMAKVKKIEINKVTIN